MENVEWDSTRTLVDVLDSINVDVKVRWILNDISKKNGIENIYLHYFRKTLVIDLLNKDITIQDVSKILEHTNIEQYYHTDKK